VEELATLWREGGKSPPKPPQIQPWVLTRQDFCNSVLAGLPVHWSADHRRVSRPYVSVADSRQWRHICSLLPLKTVVNCNVASASVSVHTCSFMALYRPKFVFNFNLTSTGCACRSEFSSRLPFCYKILTDSRRISRPLDRVTDLPDRRTLRSSGTRRLVVPPVRLTTVANRAFPVVGRRIWNDLPADVTSDESLSTFRQQL